MSITGILANIRNAGREKNSSELQSTEPSFLRFIFKEKRNRRFIWIMLAGTVVQFVIFKKLYPFADFFSDSYSYIFAAYANLDISIWPIGYSKFLRWFHFITYSDTALISFQYFFLELSCLYFFFTILYFYRPVKTNQIILFAFLFFNPLFLYISNYVNSDPLFIALSLLWFTELLWILQRPNLNHILIQGLLLFLCFTVRNNAYVYPFITIVAFALSRLSTRMKLSGAALGLLLIIPFIIHTRNAAYKMTGTKQFSLFTGWQLANNALYMYEYADTAKEFTSAKLKELDNLSKHFYSQAPSDFLHKLIKSDQGNFFIRAPYAPLKLYFMKHYKISDDYSNVVAWGKASVVFDEYGSYLIKHNLAAYAWEFMLPNAKNYFIPPLEKLQVYNLGQDKVNNIARYWFNYKNNQVVAISKDMQGIILFIVPLLFLMLHIYFISCIIWFYIQKKYILTSREFNYTMILSCLFHIANFGFCVFATIIVFRYQVFPFIIILPFSLLLTEWLDKRNLQAQKPVNYNKHQRIDTQLKESLTFNQA